MTTKKISLYGVLIALALIFSYIEAQIPVFFAVPGMKLGLTNVVVLVALFMLGDKSAMFINVVRIILVAILFGNGMSFAFSLAGGMLSTLVMILLKKSDRFGVIGVSAVGGVTHNIGQILVAMVVMNTGAIFWYLPVLWISGIVCGVLIGVIGGIICQKLPKSALLFVLMLLVLQPAVTVEAKEDEEPVIHGIYVSAYVAGTKNMMDEIIEHIDETDINAVVIDVKNDEGNIVFDMDSELVDELGAEKILVKDMPGLVKTLHEHDIYVIARCVAFRDPFMKDVKPEWMIKKASGSIYEDNKGFNWMDPRNQEARDYLIEVALKCKEAGFDEVQYDYVRFPTGIKEEDLGMNGYGRRRAVFEFVKDAHLQLKLANMPLSLDVFGTVINSRVDRNIVGQEYSWLSMYCEYLSPMIYPSHYYEGTMGKDYPDLYPYDTIDAAMKYSATELETVNPRGDRIQAGVRPWLQGFTASYLKKYRNYGAAEIKEQIKAVNDNGVQSWIIWNPSCKYPWEAFKSN